MEDKIFRGAFIIRVHDHQILTSTYFNNGDVEPYPETAKRITKEQIDEDPFAGRFRVTWLQADGHYELELEITRTVGQSLYHLTWYNKGVAEFYGHAVKEKDILFGYYWGAV